MKLKVLLQVLACITLFGGVVNAEVTADMAASSDDMKKTKGADGWTKSLKFSGNGNLAIHKSHLSEVNGENYSWGGKLDGTLTWRQGSREWRNSLLIDQSTSKLASSEHYIKGSDVFKIQSFYLWGLPNMPKFGPYAKASYDTSIFRNHSYFNGPINFVDSDGTVRTGESDFRLSDGLGDNPQTLKASIGVFYKAIKKDNMDLVLSAGLGGLRTWANGKTATKINDTNYVLTDLEHFTDYGLVLGLDFKGKFDDRTGYQVGFESLTPFDKGDDRFDDEDLITLTNYEGFAKIDSKLYEWLSLGYEFRVKMQPKLQGKEQTSNIFGLSLTYILL